MPTAIAVTSADLVLPPTDPGTPQAAVLPPPETRSLDASLADMQQLLARYGHVVVVCPTAAPAAVEHRLHAVRSLLESDRIALVRTDLPPLGAAVLVRQLRQLAGYDLNAGVLASAARLLAHYIYAGAVLGSVSRLDRVPVSLGSHLKGWLPGAHFAVLAGPTPQIVRLGSRSGSASGSGSRSASASGGESLAGPEFATELLLARGQLQTDWPTTALVPRWRIPGPVHEVPLPASSPGWWGTGKLVEFAAYLPDPSVLHQLVSSVRRETCHWCGMELIGDRCGFCAAPLPPAAPPPPDPGTRALGSGSREGGHGPGPGARPGAHARALGPGAGAVRAALP
ncbi:hypothetical protein [Streptomyces sp. TLI_105]|uniref:hypothetical protein n=1 Tax=Streptomyces sp. TLI_105 TaxID=1881019 RepID=UPI000898B5B5|nr:hypothetical protein [Streptomyces sp. TLI_105]SEC60651.1 hypothetical protein SAMN05428939_2792 [Streptomyces sp. TLI_105]